MKIENKKHTGREKGSCGEIFCIVRYLSPSQASGPPLPTITDLTDYLISHSGLDGPQVRACGRYLREEGILPVSSKRNIPQVEAVHAAALVIACTASERQLQAAQALRDVWNLPHYVPDPARLLVVQNESPPWGDTFGQAVTAIIDAYARDGFVEDDGHSEIRIRQRSNSAEIIRARLYHFYRETDPRLHPRPRPDHCRMVAEIPFLCLSWLGELVAVSRRQAAKLGLEIETASTLLALEQPPAAPPTPGSKPVEVATAPSDANPSSPDAPSATPESKTATSGPARDTNAAALSDQPAETELDGRSEEPHSAGEREKTQSPSNSRFGRPCNLLRSDVDDRHQHAYAGPLAA